MIDRDKVKIEYKEWVDKVSEDLEDKTFFTIGEVQIKT